MPKKFLDSVLLVAGIAIGTAAQAGAGCGDGASDTPANPQLTAMAIASANATVETLNKTDDSVVLIARMGQDLRQYGLTYSHVGFAVRQNNGDWLVVHKLNKCGSDQADVYEESVVRFFMDDPFEYKAAIWRLAPHLQVNLKPVLMSKASLRMHEPAYNMLAYPFSTKYQNSNGWTLETLAHAIEPPLQDRPAAIEWLHQQGYQPSTLVIGALKRLGARALKSNIAFDDQPSSDRWANRIQTVTVDSMIAFLKRKPGICLKTECPELTITP